MSVSSPMLAVVGGLVGGVMLTVGMVVLALVVFAAMFALIDLCDRV